MREIWPLIVAVDCYRKVKGDRSLWNPSLSYGVSPAVYVITPAI